MRRPVRKCQLCAKRRAVDTDGMCDDCHTIVNLYMLQLATVQIAFWLREGVFDSMSDNVKKLAEIVTAHPPKGGGTLGE